jgi:A/G-specific adenine glycosylase
VIRAGEAHSAVGTARNRALLEWYSKEARDLPWRDEGDPYRVLVSEVMLQQTRASRVIPHYERFVRRFPGIDDLAAAPLSDVMESWVGLGYNSRARRLHEAAKHIAEHGWPADIDALMDLPGVGPYTSRAIAAFGLGIEAVPVDTNVRRVLSRWHGEPLSGITLQHVADGDARGIPPADWSQAVMDLGASLCRARDPLCGECPVAAWCTGPAVYEPPRAQGRFEGSNRQLRGRIVRLLVAGPAAFTDLVADSGFDAPEVARALEELAGDGMVTSSRGRYRLPG